MGMNPPQWLKPGDVIEVNISKIGTLHNGVKYQNSQ
jgi:2-keto-4-pentenoate hydratase/2-oxohepta-3-ene-1,7-dioic acid hydratase in catechol pathway